MIPFTLTIQKWKTHTQRKVQKWLIGAGEKDWGVTANRYKVSFLKQ